MGVDWLSCKNCGGFSQIVVTLPIVNAELIGAVMSVPSPMDTKIQKKIARHLVNIAEKRIMKTMSY